MLSLTRHWILTFAAAALAVVLAAAGLLMSTLAPVQAPALSAALLVGSLGMTAIAFVRVAMRVRRLELENEGLIEEISQEFDRVKDKIDVFADALAAPRTLSPEEEATAQASARRVMVK